MGVSIIKSEDTELQAMYCNTTMWAFGPIFEADEDVQSFIDWLGQDPRSLEDNELELIVSKWRYERSHNGK